MTDAWDGRPQNPERDGWHFYEDRDGDDFAAWWNAEKQQHLIVEMFLEGSQAFSPSQAIVLRWRYLGPCLTPAEVAAAVAQARRKALEEAALMAERVARDWAHTPPAAVERGGLHIAAAIRALIGADDAAG